MGWTDWIQTAVAVVGVGLVVWELHEVKRGLRSTARGSIYDTAARVKDVFISKPSLRPYFFEEAPMPDDPATLREVMAVADLYCLYLEQIATHRKVITSRNRTSWERYVRAVVHSSPAVRAHLEGKEAQYAPEFWEVVRGSP
jgi:hypothetical protein